MTMTDDNIGGVKQNSDYNREYTLKDPDHDEIKDGYQLRWVGKNYAKLQENLRPETVIVPDAEHNAKAVNKDSQNLFLTGDNLEVLKHLEHSYTGKVDMIYIDPPYNTGSDGFVYGDNFRFTDDQLRDTLGLTEAEVKKIRNIYGKASHSAWLTFMYPRLKLAKKLLSDTGVIFVSIDDNEQHNLRLLMDEIFNEGSFSGQIIWKNSSKNDEKYISTQHEYFLVYVKNKTLNIGDWTENKEGLDSIYAKFDELHKRLGDDWRAIHKEAVSWYATLNESNPIYSSRHYSWMDERGVYFPADISGPNFGQYRYDVIHPVTNKVVKEPASGWRYPENTMALRIKDGFIHFGVDEKTIPNNKIYLKDTEAQSLTSIKFKDGRVASNALKSLMGGNYFTNPKNVDMLAQFINAVNFDKDNTLILDFFAGSGTTAQAVMQLNRADGGNRRYIMCTLDEPVKKDSEAEKAGFKTIDQIARKRIELAAEQLGDTSGFRHFRFATPKETTLEKVEDFDPTAQTLVADDMLTPFSEKSLTGNGVDSNGVSTILTTWLVDDGYDFNTKAEELDLAGYKAHYAKDIARLYLIGNKGWNKESCKQLLNGLGKNEIAVNAIVIYAYSFNFVDLTELKNNLKANLDKTPQIIERY